MGDINIAHTQHDIKNWKGNLKSAGFLPEERAYLDAWVVGLGRRSPGDRGCSRRPVHVVVPAGQGLRHRHRLAARLPVRDARARRRGDVRRRRTGGVVGRALVGPRAAHRRLRPRATSVGATRREVATRRTRSLVARDRDSGTPSRSCGRPPQPVCVARAPPPNRLRLRRPSVRREHPP